MGSIWQGMIDFWNFLLYSFSDLVIDLIDGFIIMLVYIFGGIFDPKTGLLSSEELVNIVGVWVGAMVTLAIAMVCVQIIISMVTGKRERMTNAISVGIRVIAFSSLYTTVILVIFSLGALMSGIFQLGGIEIGSDLISPYVRYNPAAVEACGSEEALITAIDGYGAANEITNPNIVSNLDELGNFSIVSTDLVNLRLDAGCNDLFTPDQSEGLMNLHDYGKSTPVWYFDGIFLVIVGCVGIFGFLFFGAFRIKDIYDSPFIFIMGTITFPKAVFDDGNAMKQGFAHVLKLTLSFGIGMISICCTFFIFEGLLTLLEAWSGVSASLGVDAFDSVVIECVMYLIVFAGLVLSLLDGSSFAEKILGWDLGMSNGTMGAMANNVMHSVPRGVKSAASKATNVAKKAGGALGGAAVGAGLVAANKGKASKALKKATSDKKNADDKANETEEKMNGAEKDLKGSENNLKDAQKNLRQMEQDKKSGKPVDPAAYQQAKNDVKKYEGDVNKARDTLESATQDNNEAQLNKADASLNYATATSQYNQSGDVLKSKIVDNIPFLTRDYKNDYLSKKQGRERNVQADRMREKFSDKPKNK